jgi:Holliday junction resolvase RusA-like endonuclease
MQRAIRIQVTAIFSVPNSWSGKRQREALAGLIRPTVRPDVDNVLKTLDALNGVVWRDDNVIVDCSITKYYGDIPSLRIEVWEHTGLLL